MCYIVFISHRLPRRYIKIALRKYVIICFILILKYRYNEVMTRFSGNYFVLRGRRSFEIGSFQTLIKLRSLVVQT